MHFDLVFFRLCRFFFLFVSGIFIVAGPIVAERSYSLFKVIWYERSCFLSVLLLLPSSEKNICKIERKLIVIFQLMEIFYLFFYVPHRLLLLSQQLFWGTNIDLQRYEKKKLIFQARLSRAWSSTASIVSSKLHVGDIKL